MKQHSLLRQTRRGFSELGLILGILGLALLAMGLGGCDSDDADVIPPAIPNGVSSITGDGEIVLVWNANRERDLQGYRIWSTQDFDMNFNPINYQLIADVGADFNFHPDPAGGRPYHTYVDRDVLNGLDYFYAVSAYDFQGNESDLSTDLVIDTPRPEGTVTLSNLAAAPSVAGYDFSEELRQDFTFETTDVYFENIDGVDYLVSQSPWVRIQDYGFVEFDVATWAPELGWSSNDRVEAIVGHTYFLEIIDGEQLNYAKLQVLGFVDAIDRSVQLRWGYQPVPGLPELKMPELPQRQPTPKAREEKS